MNIALLDAFEKALRQRDPVLAGRLQPGLSRSRIQTLLKRNNVAGAVEPILTLFAWKNGTRLDPSIREHASPFPGSIYMFMDLEMMLADVAGFKELSRCRPEYAGWIGRYFPIFWDGSTSWLAVDLDPSKQSRVVIVDPESGPAVREVYPSFDDFLRDAVRANQENDSLTCFRIPGPTTVSG